MIGLMGRSRAGARKRGQAHGLVGDLLRLFVAAGLLAGVALVTVSGVNSAGSKVEQGRLNIVDVNPIADGREAQLIGSAHDLTRPNSAASHE